MQRLQKILDACEWVSQKGAGGRDACGVATDVKWADWDRKKFSPAMCVLWRSTVSGGGGGDGYDTFVIPPAETWISRVAGALEAPEEWVKKFVEQCHNGCANPDHWTFSVTFDGVDGTKIRNPKVEWKKLEPSGDSLLPEVEAILSKYGSHTPAHQPAYWTKNPPVDMYKSKLVSAVYDLFCALEARAQNRS